jgi:hypothetical protein
MINTYFKHLFADHHKALYIQLAYFVRVMSAGSWLDWSETSSTPTLRAASSHNMPTKPIPVHTVQPDDEQNVLQTCRGY